MDANAIREKLAGIRVKTQSIDILVDDINALLSGDSPAPEPVNPVPSPTPQPAPVRNPYADTMERVPLLPDSRLIADKYFQDPLLQSRYWRALWNIADRLGIPLTILRGEHNESGDTTDIRYPAGRDMRIAVIRAILDRFPVYDKETQYLKWITDESEVRVSPEFKADMFPDHPKVQGDSLGNHDDNPLNGHLHVTWPKVLVTTP